MVRIFFQKHFRSLTIITILIASSCNYLDYKYNIYGVSTAQDGIVKAYDFSSGEKGNEIGTGSLESGTLKISVAADKEIILLELEKFSFLDKIGKKKITSNESTKWETLIVSPKPNSTYNINPVTTLTSALARYKINSSDKNNSDSIKLAIEDANKTTGEHLGTIDIIGNIPNSLDSRIENLSSETKYEFILTSLNELAYHYQNSFEVFSNSSFNILDLTKSLCEDITFDGVIDGNSENGNTLIGEQIQSDKILKSELASSIYRVVENPSVNKTGLTFTESYDFINNISSSKSSLFKKDSPSYPFDFEPPEIKCEKPIDGYSYSDDIEIECYILDKIPGVAETKVKFNETDVQNLLTTPEVFYAKIGIDPLNTAIGTIEITATDKIGNRNIKTINISINKP